MSAPVRFLFVAIAGWALFRGATMGMLPGAEAFTFAPAKAEAAPAPLPSPIMQTEFPPLPPVQAAAPPEVQTNAYGGYPQYYPAAAYGAPGEPRYVPVPVYYYPQQPAARSVTVPLPQAQVEPVAPAYYPEPPQYYSPLPKLDGMQFAQAYPQSVPDWNGQPQQPSRGILGKIIPPKHLDRLQFSAWALMRGEPGTGSLANGGTLGGSQAGARLTYAFNPHIAASLRSSSPLGGGGRGGEVAAGVRVTPIPSIPFSITAERRQAIGKFSTGRSDFALFAEGGVYQKPLGWNLWLDGYAQAGVVGLRERDFFADGGFSVTRPVWGKFSIGVGAWGGYQPGVYRIDAGPRISWRVRPNISIHADYRQRLAGAAAPSSGPALTLGANF